MLRKANIGDVISINILGNKYLPEFSKTYDVKGYISSSAYEVLVYGSEIICGFIIVHTCEDDAEIEFLYVDDEFRNKSIATLLINEFLTKFQHIFLEVNENNIPAQRLYEKNGFVEYNRRKNYYGDNDAILMRKDR